MSKTIQSYCYLTVAQIIIGANIVTAKSLLVTIPIYVLLTLRFMIGSLILSVICYVKKENPLLDEKGNSLTARDWLVLFSQALCAGFLFNSFILSGLNYTSASTAGIISSITPAVIALLSYIILKEMLGVRHIVAILLAVLGLVVISATKQSNAVELHRWFGDFLVLCSVFPEALFTVIAKWYKKDISNYSMSLIINVFNVFLFLPIAIGSLKYLSPTISTMDIGLVLLYGILGGAVYFLCWYRGLEGVTASVAAIFTAVMPLSTVALGYLFLQEKLTIYDVIGGTLVILSIFIGSVSVKKLKFKNFLMND